MKKNLLAIGGMLLMLAGLAVAAWFMGASLYNLIYAGEVLEGLVYALYVVYALVSVLSGSFMMELAGVDPTPNKHKRGRR